MVQEGFVAFGNETSVYCGRPCVSEEVEARFARQVVHQSVSHFKSPLSCASRSLGLATKV